MGNKKNNLQVAFFGVHDELMAYLRQLEDTRDIVAIADSGLHGVLQLVSPGQPVRKMPILSVEELAGIRFDYVVVCGRDKLWEYGFLLEEKGISWERILGLEEFLLRRVQSVFYSTLLEKNLIGVLRAMGIQRLLDRDLFFSRSARFTKYSDTLGDISAIGLDGINEAEIKILPPMLYDRVFSARDKCWQQETYDMVLVTRCLTVELCGQLLEETNGISRYILFSIDETVPAQQAVLMMDFSRWGRARRFRYGKRCLLLVDRRPFAYTGELRIFVVTHKGFILPTDDPIYAPIQAGCGLHSPLGCLRDDVGDNISTLNPFLNECTALYWMWKHANTPFVGLVHYRRYFLRDGLAQTDNLLDEEKVREILAKYDIIVALNRVWDKAWVQMGQVIRHDMGDELYERMIHIVERLLKERQPEYLEAFHYVFFGHAFYPFQMFVTRREIMDQYCSWLFSILVDAARELDVSQEDTQHQRALAYLAERMLTVWLMRQRLRVKELPIIKFVESDADPDWACAKKV